MPLKTLQPPYVLQNRLLRLLPPAQRAGLRARLEPVRLALKDVLLRPEAAVTGLYFIEKGTVSMIATLLDGSRIEVGLVGPEGFVGLPLLLGGGTSVVEAMVQSEGLALRLPARGLKAALAEAPALLGLMLRYVDAFTAQVAQSAACNGRHNIEQRLARWLLMTHDRVGQDRFVMTQEFMSTMLGVRRPSVTRAMGKLQGLGLIGHGHGIVTMRDRPGLEAASCECYAAVRRRYEWLEPDRQAAERAASASDSLYPKSPAGTVADCETSSFGAGSFFNQNNWLLSNRSRQSEAEHRVPDPTPFLPPPRNLLLNMLPAAELQKFRARLEPVNLALRDVLIRPGDPMTAVHFVESGVISMIALLEDGTRIEVGITGSEGFIGLPLLLGGDSSAVEAMVQVEGEALRLPAAAFRAALVEAPSLIGLLLRFVDSFGVQVSQTAACNSRHQIEQRLARWLLMTRDRLDTDSFSMTQEFMSTLLGVRRPGVTLALGALQRAGVAQHQRGVIRLLDQAGLEAAACECYQVVNRRYAWLKPPARRKRRPN